MNRAIYKPVQKYSVDNLALNLTYSSGVRYVGKRDNILTLCMYVLYLYLFANNNCYFVVMLSSRVNNVSTVITHQSDLQTTILSLERSDVLLLSCWHLWRHPLA